MNRTALSKRTVKMINVISRPSYMRKSQYFTRFFCKVCIAANLENCRIPITFVSPRSTRKVPSNRV